MPPNNQIEGAFGGTFIIRPTQHEIEKIVCILDICYKTWIKTIAHGS